MSGQYGDYDPFDDIQVEDAFPEPEGIAEAAAYFAELNSQHLDETAEPGIYYDFDDAELELWYDDCLDDMGDCDDSEDPF